NKKSVRLSVESSRANGYVVDYEGEHDKYFKKDGGSWKKANGAIHRTLPDSVCHVIGYLALTSQILRY
ncbi:MAG: hypothetical protein ACYTEK_25535, partial [Planctomycetota bacterium]